MDRVGGADAAFGVAGAAPGAHARPESVVQLLDLPELELDRGRATEDGHRHAQAALLVVHFLDVAVEVGERTFAHPDHLADLEQGLGLGFLHALLHLAHDLVDLLLGDRGRLVPGAADEARDLPGVLHQVPGVVVHLHLDQDVAGEEAPLGDRPLAVLHLHHFLGRDEDLAELLLHAGPLDAVLQRAGHALLHARVGMHHVPTLAHRFHPRIRS